jgi:hypothetical protein
MVTTSISPLIHDSKNKTKPRDNGHMSYVIKAKENCSKYSIMLHSVLLNQELELGLNYTWYNLVMIHRHITLWHITLWFFIIFKFIHMYMHCLSHLPFPPPLPGRTCSVLLFFDFLEEETWDNEKDIVFLLIWDENSYMDRFLALVPCIYVLQPTLFISTRPLHYSLVPFP